MMKLLASSTLLFAACVAPRVPPHCAPSRFGVVHAADPETAQEYALLLDEVAPFVARALPGLEVEPVDLRVVAGITNTYQFSPHSEFSGAAFESNSEKWVEIRSDLDPIARRGVLAHELVHRWLGPAWDTLPPAMEDGLADVVGDAARGGDTARERMLNFLVCWITLNGELTLDRHATPADADAELFTVTLRANVARLKPAEILDVFGRDLEGYHSLQDPRHLAVVAILARRVMSRISVDRLFEACQIAAEEGLIRVPVARILAMARVDPLDLADWNALLLESYGLEERRALREEADIPWGLIAPGTSEGFDLSIHLHAKVEF